MVHVDSTSFLCQELLEKHLRVIFLYIGVKNSVITSWLNCFMPWEASGLKILIATGVWSRWPLNTGPYPPSPILFDEENFPVAISISSMEYFLYRISFWANVDNARSFSSASALAFISAFFLLCASCSALLLASSAASIAALALAFSFSAIARAASWDNLTSSTLRSSSSFHWRICSAC